MQVDHNLHTVTQLKLSRKSVERAEERKKKAKDRTLRTLILQR